MKLRHLLIGLVLSTLCFSANAQVYDMYYQTFETDDEVRFTGSPQSNVIYSTDVAAGGSRSIKLVQNNDSDVTLITDTIDFTQNTSLHYITLEFDHICNAYTNTGSTMMGLIYWKRANQSDDQWHQLTGTQEYNVDRQNDDYSREFQNTASFNRNSYETLWQTTTVTDELWKWERFDLNNAITSSVAPNERKLLIKFVLKKKNTGNTNGAGWWIDNLTIRASQNQMITPRLTMRTYPDGGLLPSSRGARITLDASTTVSQGICSDSVYVIYKVGSDATEHRITMTPVTATSPVFGTRTQYTTRIPFEGYDTTMYFYCVVKDNTTNHNEVTYPTIRGNWIEYKCVRGVAQPGIQMPGFVPTSSVEYYPFPQGADAKSEWVYDSALLAEAGYGPGAMTAMRYTVTANNTASSRPKFQLRLKNVPTSHSVYLENDFIGVFTSDYMHIVYDSTYNISEVGAGTDQTINFQDTFFYAGKDLVVQLIYDAQNDFAGRTKIGAITTPTTKKSMYFYNGNNADYNYNPYTSEDFKRSNDGDAHRPAMVITQVANQPLVYDMGVAHIAFPNDSNPIITQPSYVDVSLKNYGALAVNGIRVSYTIDDTISGYVDWSGNLASGESTTVRVASSVILPPGYHFVRSWVEDTMAVGTSYIRDHEPYNDTALAQFIVCSGPMNGVRYVGGENADFNTMDEFLFSLSQCGLDDSLVVKVAGGVYPPFVLPEVNGISAQNYVAIEPADNETVIFRSTNGSATYLVDATASPYFRFRNLAFERTGGALSNMIMLGESSNGTRIENCRFTDSLANPASTLRIESLVNTGFANNVYIHHSTFEGGGIGINVDGQAADMRSQHNRVYGNIFYNQYSSAIIIGNQSNITVEKNEMYDVLSNSSYVLRLLQCNDTVRVLSNKIYTSHGAQGLGVSGVNGTETLHALIANNMVVCADDGTANQQNTPFNIIAAQWLDVIYNSVKMTAPERNNVAAATFGGATLINSRFMNNIITCFDNSNYAFNFMPGNQTTNTIGHNVYYSLGYILNKRTGGSYSSLDAWQAAVEMDSTSVSLDPVFLNGSLVDLRTFNRLVKGIGIPFENVTTDMFDTIRNATAPCPGAFEFVSLYYDFEVEALVQPELDNCYMPENVELIVRLRNNGVNGYTPGGSVSLNVGFSVNGSAAQTASVTSALPSEDTCTVATGQYMQLPANGIYDSVHHIKVWTISPNDPNQTNDTTTFDVISRYHAEAPSDITHTIPYNTNDTIEAEGITEWSLYNSSDSPTVPSTIYWYYSPDDEEPFQSGTTYITDVLQQDTHFYVRQNREVPVVRITQVQLFRADTVVGLTSPTPEWETPVAKVVVQLTNVGDASADISNDTLHFISPTSSFNNKVCKLPSGLVLEPGQSVCVQYSSTNVSNQLPIMVRTVNYVPLYTTDFGLLYRAGGVKDAVAFNNVTTDSSTLSVRWSNINIPSYVWSGDGIQLADELHAGVIRVAYNGNANDWVIASEANPMTLGTVNPNMLRYTSNHCNGAVGVITVNISNPPQAELALEALDLSTGCFLGNEPVSVRVKNYGVNNVSNVELNYNAGGSTVSEVLTSPVPAQGDTVYTFLQPLNMAVDHDSVFNVTIWVTAMAEDQFHDNDTCYVSAAVSHTPDQPIYPDTITIDYATSDTLSLAAAGSAMPIWYNYDGVAVDTTTDYITDIIYYEGYMGVSYLEKKDSLIHIGELASVNGKTTYPSPYQPNKKYSKQQFIYSANDLTSMGLKPGNISKVYFHLDSIYKVNTSTQRDSVVFNSYDIYLGLTPDTIFSNTSAWKSTSLVYSRTNLPIYRSSSHDWVEHVFDTPFTWDGVQSLVVQVVASINPSITTGVQTAYTAKTNTTLYKAENSNVDASYSADGTRGSNRPDIIFCGKVNGCEGPIKYFYVNLNGVPDTDATIYPPDGFDTMVFNSCGNVQMPVTMRNMGSNTLNGYQLVYSIDGGEPDTTVVNSTVASGMTETVTLFNEHIMPGRHSFSAQIVVPGDSITSNDNIMENFNVRFCGGDYYIAADSTAEYLSFGEAIDSMEVAGIDGPVVFHVAGGIYNEQVELSAITGSSADNTITFQGSADSATVVIAANSSASNYVFKIDGISNVILDSLTIISRPTSGNNAHVVALMNCDNIVLQNNTIRTKGTINNQNASGVTLQGNVTNLLLSHNTIDSGYYSVTTLNNTTDYNSISLQNNYLTNFRFGGINLAGISNVNLTRNDIRSGVKSKLTGVKLEDVDSNVIVQKNKIYLVAAENNDNNGKRGLELKNVIGTNQMWAYVANNMIGLNSTGTSGLPPAGIYVDGTSSFINIYYNTVRLYAGETDATQSKAFYSNSQTSRLQVMNNIFANLSKAYAYYVTSGNNVSASDYNVYYAGGEKLAFWGNEDKPTLTDLQTGNSKDGSSINEEPYFAANDDLHLVMTNFVGLAQYNTDVIDDIDDTIREQIPAPTIGAHEMKRKSHNMSIVRILEPTMPDNINNPNNIESDTVLVKAVFYNNGTASEGNVRWRAYLEGYEDVIFSPIRTLGSFTSGQMKIDSVYMPTVLGVIDTQTLHIELLLSSNVCDDDTTDNNVTTELYLAPAFDLEAVRLTVPSGCELQNSQISITLKNVGFKSIPAGEEFEIGYHAQGYHPSISINNLANNQISISTMPDTVIELNHSFDTPLARNSSRDITFNTTANLYPTDTALNIKVRVNGWCNFGYDVTKDNDSTKLASSSSPQVDSWYTPDAPVGRDTTLKYAVWGEVTASQINSRPIRWYRDSTLAPFYSVNNYNNSCKWSTTPQYFHDTTYYLQSFSDKNCPSYFSPVTVHVMAQEPNDVGIRTVLAPIGGRVYMENDTVRVRIENYGTLPQSNIPVVYQLRRGNNTAPIQMVTDTCRVTIQPNEYYDFQFDTLLQFTSAVQSGNYQLRVWTDLANDATRRNDTIRMVTQLRPAAINNTTLDYAFTALGDCYINPTSISGAGLDFIRLSYNEIDVDLPPLGRHYTNFSAFGNPEYPVLRIRRGSVDTIQMMVVNPDDPNERTRGKVAVYIDFDRSGDFEDDPAKNVIPSTQINSLELFKAPITIDNNASYGYMKMRAVVTAYENVANSTLTTSTGDAMNGHVLDFLLYVEPEPADVDLALTHFVEPRNSIVLDTTPVKISLRMFNKGIQPITSVDIHYSFVGDTIDSLSTGVYHWQGLLSPKTGTIVNLPDYRFHIGTYELTVWHEFEGDTIKTNDTLQCEFHRFHVVEPIYNDFFDNLDYWYAPKGYNNYTKNYWQLGTPAKTNLTVPYSEPHAWITDSVNTIVSGKRGNVSYLYSPIVDIARIRPDTLSFRLLRNLTGGSFLRIEYYNYENNWVNLVDENDSVLNLGSWYNDVENRSFSGTSSGGVYNRYWVPTRLVSGDFRERFQFRFVYTTPQGANDNAAFGDGCAIDDFHLGRDSIRTDVGVVAITKPENPKYGQTIYPEVVVKNFGRDTVRSLQLGYTYYGTQLARVSNYTCLIPPRGVDTFLCQMPFIITSDFPDTFNITAFTIWTSDIYDDNDTLTKSFYLSPLDNDISAESFVAPLDRVIAGDSTVSVTLRVRNFGTNPISNATFSYIVNGDIRYDEEASFEEMLGRPLQSMEYFNYTFKHHFLASMGMMNIVGIVKCDSNDYIYNDTIEKQITGISSISDLAAAAVIVDTNASTVINGQPAVGVGIQIIIDNRGARGANGFEVGFWIDNDSTTVVREVYSRDLPLQALTTGYHYFDTILPKRSAPYNYVTAFIHIDDDNDPTNDTTSQIVPQYVDMEAVEIIVEENANPDCRVFMRVRNVGNMALKSRRLRLKATVNDNELSFNEQYRVEAMQTVLLQLNRTIPKDPNRNYVGSGSVILSGDTNANNQTSIVRVVNYVESIPEVGAGQFILDQNYPNPFSHQTTIPFSLPNDAEVRFFVMDAMGHIITSTSGYYQAGSNRITIDMDRYATGVYYYGIEVDGVRQMRKMILH